MHIYYVSQFFRVRNLTMVWLAPPLQISHKAMISSSRIIGLKSSVPHWLLARVTLNFLPCGPLQLGSWLRYSQREREKERERD